jgi:hypothetical protein
MPKLNSEQLEERLQQEKVSDLKKKLDDSEKLQIARSEVAEYLSENDIYQVTKDGKYWKFVTDSQEWVFNTQDALRQSDYRLRPALNWEQFLRVMQQSGRIKQTKTCSFKDTPASVLNMLRQEEWLQPKKGRTDNTIFFDYLITALSGSKDDNALHIRQVLGWKYLHPETWQLPAIGFYGKGGAGKNLLAEKILPMIFGIRSVAKLSFKQVERFNEALAGKTVVLFDERPSREDESTMKFFIGQPSLTIEGKGQAVYDVENTALYIIATNGETGPVRIEQNGSERRWSIIKVRETLVDVVMRAQKATEEEARQLIVWADQNVYGNPDEIAHFLNECIESTATLDTHPHALHSEDFLELVQTQQDVVEDLFRDIFVDYKDFTDVSQNTLYKIYTERAKASNPGAQPMSKQNFTGRAMNFINNNRLEEVIKRTTDRINVKIGSGYTNKSIVFYSAAHYDTPPKTHLDKTILFESGAYLADTDSGRKVSHLSHAILGIAA